MDKQDFLGDMQLKQALKVGADVSSEVKGRYFKWITSQFFSPLPSTTAACLLGEGGEFGM